MKIPTSALVNRTASFLLALALVLPSHVTAVTLSQTGRGIPTVSPARIIRPVNSALMVSPLRGPSLSAPSLQTGALTPGVESSVIPSISPVLQTQAVAAAAAPTDIPVLSIGSAGEQLTGAVRALADTGNETSLGSRMDVVFDNALAAPGANATREELIRKLLGGGAEEAEETPESREAKALHDAYEAKAAAKLAAFDAEVEQIRVGRFGLKFTRNNTQQGMTLAVTLTLDSKPINDKQIQAKIASGDVSQAQYDQARTSLQSQAQGLVQRMRAILEANEVEHQAVHRQMAAIERKVVTAQLKKRNVKGLTMQSWGLPSSIPINLEAGLRYTKLYLLGGSPSDLGSELYDLMKPLVAADPTFLNRVTQKQLLEAVQLLQDSLRYRNSPESMDTQKHMRMGLVAVEEGFDYPEWRKVFKDRALQALTRTPEANEKLAGLGMRPVEQQTVTVLEKSLEEAYGRFDAAMARGADQDELQKMQELIMSLHSALGLPISTPNGMGMIQVVHSQMRPLLSELQRTNASEEVIKDAIRAFPMGESILRLGVHKLWAQGLSGKGLKVAVIDDGVDFDHPDLANATKKSVNMTRDRGDMVRGPHGTAMADILHAMAPEAEIQSYKVLSNSNLPGVMLNLQESLDLVMAALDKAKAGGAKIISMSLGAPMGYGNGAIADKIAALVKEGIAVIVSAGNSGGELPPGLQVGTPGSSPEAITVGAVDYHGRRAGFSSKGMVFNPADFTINDKPDIYTYGVNVKAAVRLPGPLYQQEMVPYLPVSGTSPATPHIAAVVAMMYEAAQKAGISLDGPAIVEAVRSALREAATNATGVMMLESAEKAVAKFIRLLTPIV